jgi:hypothetical protein
MELKIKPNYELIEKHFPNKENYYIWVKASQRHPKELIKINQLIDANKTKIEKLLVKFNIEEHLDNFCLIFLSIQQNQENNNISDFRQEEYNNKVSYFKDAHKFNSLYEPAPWDEKDLRCFHKVHKIQIILKDRTVVLTNPMFINNVLDGAAMILEEMKQKGELEKLPELVSEFSKPNSRSQLRMFQVRMIKQLFNFLTHTTSLPNKDKYDFIGHFLGISNIPLRYTKTFKNSNKLTTKGNLVEDTDFQECIKDLLKHSNKKRGNSEQK